MPNKCVVPGCCTGYASCKDKLSIFSAPKNEELRKRWEEAVRPTKPLTHKHVVCEKHFEPELIVRSYKHRDEAGNLLAEVPLKYARLVTNAVPTIFRVERTRKNVKNVDREGNNNAVPEPNSDTEILENNNICKNETGSILIVQSLENPVMQDVSQSAPCPQSKSSFPKIDWKAAIVSDPFVELLEHSSIIQLPENWFTATASTKKCIAFYDLHWKDEQEALYPAMRKSLTIGDNMEAHYSVNRGRINPLEFSFPDRFESLDIVNETLQRFASMNICCGIGMYDDVNLVREKIGYTDNANQLRHKRCSIITVKQQCDACKQVRKVIYQKKYA